MQDTASLIRGYDSLTGTVWCHSVEVLERLIMPEYDPSMAPFVRWKPWPRFIPPKAPTAAAAAGGGDAAAMSVHATA